MSDDEENEYRQPKTGLFTKRLFNNTTSWFEVVLYALIFGGVITGMATIKQYDETLYIGVLGTCLIVMLVGRLLGGFIDRFIKRRVRTIVDEEASKQTGAAAQQTGAAAQHKTCPFCAEEIKVQAIVCKHCSRDLPPDASASTTASTLDVPK